MLNSIVKSVDTISKWTGALAAVLLCGIAVMIISEIFARAVLGMSISFVWEYGGYFYAISIFCGAAYTLRTGGHVRVTLFGGMFGERGKYIMELIATFLGTGVAFFIAYSLIHFAWRSYVKGSLSPTIDATPLVIPQTAIAIGAIILALQMVMRIVCLIAGLPVEDEEAKNSFKVD